jgi:CheY-like chemotaxis protein
MVSHELKNPLFPIMGFSETLQKPKIFGELSSKQLDAIKKISKNATYLHSIINDLLDIQNLELDTMEFDYGKFKVDELMSQACKKFESKIIERKIQLVNTTQDSIVIQSDESRIKQVLSHLIDNATAFVPKENGKIEICAQEADDNVLFYVKDNGVGISKEKQENLFKKFYQVTQGHQRKHGGAGLGLSICKGIITKLGGKIWVESEPDKGSTFTLKIPKKRRRRKSEKMKILGIDDNEDLLQVCELVMNSEGHEYTGIDNGKEGLELIRDEKFDVLLLDLSMPDFSGQEVMDALVKDGIMNKQKIVVFTATSPTKKEIGLYLEKGAHSVLKKPVEPDDLSEFIHKLESER